ncbi:hypothetical protein LTR53_014846 [Teratosphaeriaceae sp. CCFEE 6253]|nr:hypothetical protein LTR53_014846 [Teratosphaeriaceae sp. CCFEE 6253]
MQTTRPQSRELVTTMSSQKRKRSPEPSSSSSSSPSDTAADIHISDPIEDRESKFIGYYSPSLAAPSLQQHPLVKSASHKILAWRKEGKQRSLTGSIAHYETGHDDDGEKHGGRTVEKVLTQTQVTGACVVARWYGGVMLGPVRFRHMEDCAKGAVAKWRAHEEGERRAKRVKEAEEAERGRLARALGERDRSVEVLRAMAGEKEGRVRDALLAGMAGLEAGAESADGAGAPPVVAVASPVAATASPKKPAVDYSSMPLDRLRALDKARDATLSFLLKRISKADSDLLDLRDPDRPP